MRIPGALVALLISAGGASAATPEEVAAICAEAAKRYDEQFGSAQSAAREPVVAMYKHTFCPRKLTVKQGATVKFVNVDKRTTHSFWFRDAGKPESERFLPGAVVIRQGDMGDKFYLVRSGKADVFVQKPAGSREHKATIEEGGFFGERSLLLSEPRNATIVAQTPLELYCLDKEHFLEAIQQSGTLKEQVLKVYFSRR